MLVWISKAVFLKATVTDVVLLVHAKMLICLLPAYVYICLVSAFIFSFGKKIKTPPLKKPSRKRLNYLQ